MGRRHFLKSINVKDIRRDTLRQLCRSKNHNSISCFKNRVYTIFENQIYYDKNVSFIYHSYTYDANTDEIIIKCDIPPVINIEMAKLIINNNIYTIKMLVKV